MAFDPKLLSKTANLNPVAGAAGSKQFWHYDAAADSVATAVAAGYFNNARGYLRVGDTILLIAASQAACRVLTVTAVPATGNVTVAAAAFS